MLPPPSSKMLTLIVACWLGVACQPSDEIARDRATPARSSGTIVRASPMTSPAPERLPDPAEIHANELGVIPVLMYHRIRSGGSDYDRSRRAFVAELRRLYREGYRPVRAIDLVSGNIDLPAGRSPVVLTFDDSSREQFAYRNGRIDPRTAVGLLIGFARRHPGFGAVATMYVNGRPFNSDRSSQMLRDLHRRGFELGNHTFGHPQLSSLSRPEVRKELALGKRVIVDAVPSARVRTLALPLGISPRPRSLARRGAWRGIHYRHDGVFLVGAGPAPSPFDRDFDPWAIPRIRSMEQKGRSPSYGSEFWLDYLTDHPRRRYISDGDPRTIAIPARLKDRLAKRFAGSAVVYGPGGETSP